VTTILNADLHCHSIVSDGTLTPEALAVRASAHGVELWALTDHDEVGGQHRAAAAAKAEGMRYLTGTEISVTFLDQTVHIVGLGFDPDDADLLHGLRKTRGGREQRAMEMSDGLAKVGIKGAYEGALKFVGNPELISRTHFARFLVESGVCKETNEVFRKVLTEGRPGFVPLGFTQGCRHLDYPSRRHGRHCTPGAVQIHSERGVRALHRIQGAWRPGC
jgi:predicted metal-dependent phosphoesterase TrpH